MKIRLRNKGQLTLPSAMVAALGFRPGDLFDCVYDDGAIKLIPSRSVVTEREKNAA